MLPHWFDLFDFIEGIVRRDIDYENYYLHFRHLRYLLEIYYISLIAKKKKK